jgi:hypothetical protein
VSRRSRPTRDGGPARERRTPRAAPARTPREQEARVRALHALNAMRTSGVSLTQAARLWQTTPATVRRYVGGALRPDVGGRYRASASDRLSRRLEFLTAAGPVPITVRGSKAASQVARYWAAVQRYVLTGQTDALNAFRNQTIRAGKLTYRFLTDAATLKALGHAHELSFDRLYVQQAA